MKIKNIIDEVFADFFITGMLIAMPKCTFKCCIEQGIDIDVCQNSHLWDSEEIEISNKDIIKRYVDNVLTNSIIFGGLEPFESFDEIYLFIKEFREYCTDPIVIYTGFNLEEIKEEIEILQIFPNIYLKVGRYIHGRKSKYDDVLKVTLASDNQRGIKIS